MCSVEMIPLASVSDRSIVIARAVAALGPRTGWLPPPDHLNHALLECYRALVLGLANLAIATDWDTGYITRGWTADRLPFEDEVLAHVGQTRGLAVKQLENAYDVLRLADSQLEAAKIAVGGTSPLDHLCTENGVGRIGSLLLLLVAAPALWGETARLYGILANDPQRAGCDEHLLYRLVGEPDRRVVGRELDHGAPLIRRGLVRVVENGRRPFRRLVVDETVVRLLRGEAGDDDGERGVERINASVQLEDFVTAPGVVDRALAEIAALSPRQLRLVVRGQPGSGRRTLLACVGRLAGKAIALIDAPLLAREKRVEELKAMLQRANLRGMLPCVDGLDALPPGDDTNPEGIRAALHDHEGPVALRLSSHGTPPLESGYVLIDLPTLQIAARAAQWRALATEMQWALDAEDLAARYCLGPGTICRVASQVADLDRSDNPGPTLESALRRHVENRFGVLATKVTATASITDVVLPNECANVVEELIARRVHWNTVYETWGLGRVVKASRGLTVLIDGPSGTGKTMLAGALARSFGLDLYRVDVSQVFSKWIGETEKNLARVFDAAEQARAMVLFDEADSVLARRAPIHSATDRYSNLEINYLLQRLETFDGVAAMTTNLASEIDPSFRRRISCTLTLQLPDVEAREQIWRNHLPAQIPTAGALDFADLARRHELSGGAICNAVVRAAFFAASDGTPVSQFHLERAIRAEVRDRHAKMPDGHVRR